MACSNDLMLSILSPCQRMGQLIAEIAKTEKAIPALTKLRSEVESTRAIQLALCARVWIGDIIYRTNGAVDPVSKVQRDRDKSAYYDVVDKIGAFEARFSSLTRSLLPYYADIIDENTQLKSDLATEKTKVQEKEGELENSLAIRQKLQIDIFTLGIRKDITSKTKTSKTTPQTIDLITGSLNFEEEKGEYANLAKNDQSRELVESRNIIKELRSKVKILEDTQQISDTALNDARKQQQQFKNEYELVVAGQEKERRRARDWQKKLDEGIRQIVDLRAELDGTTRDLNYFKIRTNLLRDDKFVLGERLDALQVDNELLEEKLRQKDSEASRGAQAPYTAKMLDTPMQAEVLRLRVAREKTQREAAAFKDRICQLENKVRVSEILEAPSMTKHKNYKESRQNWRNYAKRLRTELKDNKQELVAIVADKEKLSKDYKKLRKTLKGLLSSIVMEDLDEECIAEAGTAPEQADVDITRRRVEVRRHFRNYPRRLAKKGK